MMKIPSLSPVEFEILGLLRSREMYGLEMVKESTKLKRGTIYVTLDRMTDKGFVKSRLAERASHESGLPRRIYGITALGQRTLAANEAAAASFAEWSVA